MRSQRHCPLFLVVALAAYLWAAPAGAQQPTVVQLPTFSYFTVNTTVLVPDGGTMVLGGVGSAAVGRAQHGFSGPLGNTGIGGTAAAGGISITAQIHDFQAMEAQLLGQSAAAGAASLPGHSLLSKPQFSDSIAAIRAANAREDQARQLEALANLDRGRKLLADGQPGAAKIYLQMAANRAAGDTRQQALQALREIEDARARRTASR